MTRETQSPGRNRIGLCMTICLASLLPASAIYAEVPAGFEPIVEIIRSQLSLK